MPKVLFIASMGRSGSTILDTILGQVDGYVSLGEVRFVWQRSLEENRYCGCGQRFLSCPFWSQVFEEAFSGMGNVAPLAMTADMNRTRTRYFPLMLIPGSEHYYRRSLADYLRTLAALYRAIAKVAESEVIVDSSKYPSHAYLLRLIDGFDVRVLHLTRDPRAVANSWMQEKYDPDRGTAALMPQQSPWISAAFWNIWNVTIEALGKRSGAPYRVLRYEDLMEEPRLRVREILEFAGRTRVELPFVGDREVQLFRNHTVSGNPGRFTTGRVQLRADERWRHQLSRTAALTTNCLTWPVRAHLGYRGSE